MSDVTRVLGRVESGERCAREELFPLVYAELRKLAAAKMAQETPGQTLQAIALVHEAYARLMNADQPPRWNSHGHFFAAAAEALRRVFVEQARRKASPESGGHLRRCDPPDVDPPAPRSPVDILALDGALDRWAAKDPRKAALVKLRFFAGLSNGQAAAVLGISLHTALSDWRYARAWLRIEMEDQLATGG